jgi:hypothetical protein
MAPDTSQFPIGATVLYEVSTPRGSRDFEVEAVVIDRTARRVYIEFSHWSDGRTVRRRVQPHRLRLKGDGNG